MLVALSALSPLTACGQDRAAAPPTARVAPLPPRKPGPDRWATEIAAAEGIDLGQASKMSRLAQLAPDLIEAIALGRLEVGVSQLLRGKLSASWQAQREALVAGSR